MRLRIPHNIYPGILLALTGILVGCADDDLIKGGNKVDTNAVNFRALSVGAAQASMTRSAAEPEYQPLELQSEAISAPLYLHTYEVGKIGYRPGDPYPGGGEGVTRGNPVEDAEALKEIHENFKVYATASDNGEHYFGWSDAHSSSADDNRWITTPTEYWPGGRELSFRAVSPASEYQSLGNLSTAGGLEFSYTAHKGTSNDDAESQPDLLLASGACAKSGSDEGRAPLVFHHALSAVKFAVRDVMGGEVVNVSIAGVKSSGKCKFAPDPTTGLGVVEWSEQDGAASYSQDFNYRVNDPYATTDNPVIEDVIISNEMPEKTFMLIPQEIPADAEIIVTLKFDSSPGLTVEMRGKIRANGVTEWKPGYEYVYTISTSKANWTYVLQATGNHRTSLPGGAHDVSGGDYIYVYSPAAISVVDGRTVYPHSTYGNQAFMDVVSYRYRTNRPSLQEKVAWEGSNDATGQYRLINGVEGYIPGRDLTASQWLTTQDQLSGEGTWNVEGERRNLEFTPHHQLTDWPGDAWMQANAAYAGNSKEQPWDLSTCGGQTLRNTANCYVIDRQGWYSFPTVYGNAYKNGNDNKSAYTYSGGFDNHPTMSTFPASVGIISAPAINGGVRAEVLWSDVHNTISDVSYSNGRIVFRANKDNMQQGNVLIGLYDSGGRILWSWHIWITEHWLDSGGMYNAVYDGGMFAEWRENPSDPSSSLSAKGWRNRGDVLINNEHVSGDYGFYISPYNLGWCDPKNVDYLRRRGMMRIRQVDKDGNSVGLTAELPIIQEGERVEYKVGNNTYYQWGRKDPFIGFVNHSSSEKRNFGTLDISYHEGHATINEVTANPAKFYHYAASWGASGYGEWMENPKINLWNNNVGELVDFSHEGLRIEKTVYDPCPPGYMVPPAYMYRFVGTDAAGTYTNDGGAQNKDLMHFNGDIPSDDRYTLWACAEEKSRRNARNTIWLPSTGERWDKGTPLDGILTGQNFNPQIVYLWTANCGLGKDDVRPGYPYAYFNGFSLALGLDEKSTLGGSGMTRSADGTPDKYIICAYFPARKTMARPVRAIREQ